MDTPNTDHAGMEGSQGGSLPSFPVDPNLNGGQPEPAKRKGGRPRKDGLTPGSPEALAADKARDAARKRDARQAAAGDAPPLPMALGEVPGNTPNPEGGNENAVSWDASDVQGVFEDFLPDVEEWMQNRLAAKAAKVPGAAPGFVEEVRRDAAWGKGSKKAIAKLGPPALCKLLNKLGVASENAPECVLGGAVLAVGVSHILLGMRLDKMAKGGQSSPAQGEPPKADA